MTNQSQKQMTCSDCGSEFDSQELLDRHNGDRHSKGREHQPEQYGIAPNNQNEGR